MTNTHYLGMPFIEGSQAQKHITHNEALRILDAAIQIGVLDTDRTAPPSTPAEGDRHIVASGATGAWAGQDDAVAAYEDGAWRFLTPTLGWCAWSGADGVLLVYDGAAWTEAAGGIGTMSGSVAQLGINDTASDPNLLTVKSNAALFNAVDVADGGTGDMRVQVSKEGSSNTASVVFSNAFSGRAEFGLVESDAFKLKVSNDGTTFVEAITFDQSTGNASLQRGLALAGVISPSQITSAQNDYAPTGFAAASTLRLSSDASRNVTGLAGGADGRTIIVHNVGSQTIVLTNQDAASAAANRFLLGGNVTLAANASLSLRYDSTTQRWRAISPTSSGGGGAAAGMTDVERQNSLLGLIYQSKSLGDIRRLVNLFATGFKASTDTLRGIAAGSSSNYDAANAAAGGYVLPTATVSGTTVTINSADTTVAGQTYTFVDRTTALVNSVTVSRIGWYSTVARSVTAKIVKRNSANNYDVAVSQTFTHTGSGWEDFTLTSPYAVPGSGSYYLAGYVAAGGSNPNVKNTSGGRAYVNADLSGTGQATAGEDTGSTYPMRYTHTATNAPADMTLVTAAQTADSSVSTGRVLIEYDNTAAPALNTDLTVEISANGGTNWTSAALSAVTSYSQGGRKVAETADTALTSGTSFQARIKTLNGKSVPIYGVGLLVR